MTTDDNGPSLPVAAALPEKDAWEDALRVESDDVLFVEVDARIRYVDSEGQESRRSITTKSIFSHPTNGEALHAFCKGRQANRTFLVHRIAEFVDEATGEVVPDVRRYLEEVYSRTPAGIVDAALADYGPEATVLFFIGRASGRLTAKERLTICAWISQQGSIEIDDAASKDVADSYHPSMKAFRTCLKHCAASDEDRRRSLLSAIDAVAATRAAVDEFTTAAVSAAKRALLPPTGKRR